MADHNSIAAASNANILAVLLLIAVSGVRGQTFAPVTLDDEVCRTLDPGYAVDSQPTSSSPVAITPTSGDYTTGSVVRFTIDVIALGASYRGLIVQARAVGTTTPVGTMFTPSNEDMQVVTCTSSSDTLTHTVDDVKSSSITVVWLAPSTDVGDIEFVGTFITDQSDYWVGVKSEPIYGPTSYCRDNSVICQNGGVCYGDTFNLFRCDCSNTGYTGTTCLIKITTCDDDPCLNGAICFSPGNGQGFLCQCAPGWDGETCTIRDNCDPDPCQNSGVCTNSADRTTFECDCGPDYVDDVCSIPNYCANTPCANGRPCSNNADNTGFECDCGAEYLTETCEVINYCEPDPCQNGRPCRQLNDNSGFRCVCGTQFAGDVCQFENFCREFPCLNGATCANNGDNDGFECDCTNADGFMGPTCSDPIIPPPCDSDPCQNEGGCFEENDMFFCLCESGWIGTTCEIQDFCVASPCQNTQPCSNNADNTDFVCDCSSDFVGETCEFTNFCFGNPCQNNQPCSNSASNDGFECDCSDEYLGETCAITNYCFGDPCQNGQPCSNSAGNTGFECACSEDYLGETCEITNFCASTPCLNNRPCSNNDANTDFECDCGNEYLNKRCQTINHCFGDPCQNGQPCSNNADNSGFECDCSDEYLGDACEITNYCTADPCLNGGTCANNAGNIGFECDCTNTGFTGTACEDEIVVPTMTTAGLPETTVAPEGCGGPSPCLNGARCLANICVCATGYAGDYCGQNINECASNPCPAETSTCIDLVNDFSCVCKSGYMGELCDQTSPGANDAQSGGGNNLLLDPWWIALICLMSVLTLILIGVAACTCRSVQAESKSMAPA